MDSVYPASRHPVERTLQYAPRPSHLKNLTSGGEENDTTRRKPYASGDISQEYYPLLQSADRFRTPGRLGHFMYGAYSNEVLAAYKAAIYAYLVVLLSMVVLSLTHLIFCKFWELDRDNLLISLGNALWLVSPLVAGLALRKILTAHLMRLDTPSEWNLESLRTILRCISRTTSFRLFVLSYAVPLLCQSASYALTSEMRVVNPFHRSFVERVEDIFIKQSNTAKDEALLYYILYSFTAGIFWDVAPPPGYDFGSLLHVKTFGCSWILLSLVEEIGWSGSLYPAFDVIFHRSAHQAPLLTGLIWAMWHWPLILAEHYQIIPENSGYVIGYTHNTPLLYILSSFTLTLMGTRVIICWIQGKSSMIWPSVFYHACHKLFIISIFGQLVAPLQRRSQIYSYFAGESSVFLVISVWFSACILSRICCNSFLPRFWRR